MKVTLSKKHLNNLDKDYENWLAQFLGEEFTLVRDVLGLELQNEDQTIDLSQIPSLKDAIIEDMYCSETHTLAGSSGGSRFCQLYKDKQVHVPHILPGRAFYSQQSGTVEKICGGFEDLDVWVLQRYTPGDAFNLATFTWRNKDLESLEEEPSS